MSAGDQFTEAHLSDGTVLKLRGQLSPDQVQQKVAAFRSSKASKIQSSQTDVTDPSSPDNQSAQPRNEGSIGPLEEGFGPSVNRLKQRLLDAMSYGKGFSSPEAAQSAAGTVGGLFGPGELTIAHGVSQIPQHPVKGANEVVRGAGQTLALPMAVANPSTMAFAAPGMVAQAGVEKGAKKIGMDSDWSELAGNIAGIGTGARVDAALHSTPLPPLVESAHRILGDAATKTKQLIGQGGKVHQAVSDHFGRLANDVYAADYADTATSGKKIDTSPIWDMVTKYSDDYSAGKTTPNFNVIADAIQKRPVDMTFKELHDLKKEVGGRWDKAKPGTPDAGAASKALDTVNGMLDQRASDIGRSKQWDAANTIWSTLKEYQGDGALNKLLSPVVDPAATGAVTEGGKQFFDTLRDPANAPKFKEINKALEPYGMPADYFTDLAQSHKPLHNLVTNTGTNMTIGGKMRAIGRATKENPLVSIPAVGTGMAVGSGVGSLIKPGIGTFVGGTMGATKALRMVEEMAARKAINKLGGVPPEVNPMESASQVQPVGSGEKAVPPDQTPPPTAQQRPLSPKPAAAPTVNEDEIVSALANQGYPRKTARSMAQSAIQDHPHDFDAALRQALGQKASNVEDAMEEARRGGPGSAPPVSRPANFSRSTKSGTPQSIADQIKSAKAGKPDTRADTHKATKADIEKETKKGKK